MQGCAPVAQDDVMCDATASPVTGMSGLQPSVFLVDIDAGTFSQAVKPISGRLSFTPTLAQNVLQMAPDARSTRDVTVLARYLGAHLISGCHWSAAGLCALASTATAAALPAGTTSERPLLLSAAI